MSFISSYHSNTETDKYNTHSTDCSNRTVEAVGNKLQL